MALDFPASPTPGQEYGNYYWDGTLEVWRSKPLDSAVASTGTTPPVDPKPGDLWYNTIDGTLFVYYYDSNTYQWVEVKANSTLGTTVADRVTAIENTRPNVNYIINGAFDIWQRGTSFTGTNTYVADRWSHYTDGTGGTRSISQQTFAVGETPVSTTGSQYFLRYSQTASPTGQTIIEFTQPIEDVRTLAGQTVTFSFWVKSDAQRNISVFFRQIFGTGGSPYADSSSVVVTAGTSWSRVSGTITVPSISGKTIGTNNSLQFKFQLPFGVTQTTDVWGFQVESGSIATPFHRNAPSIQAELAACQRYYYRRAYEANSNTYNFGMSGHGRVSSVGTWFFGPHPVPMRSAPTLSQTGTIRHEDWSGATVSHSSVNQVYNTTHQAGFILSRTSGTWGANTGGMMIFASTDGYLEFNAEL